MNAATLEKAAPQVTTVTVTLNSAEIRTLARASERFLTLAHVVTQRGVGAEYDIALADLQRLRPILEKITPFAEGHKVSPLRTLDTASRKQLPNIFAMLNLNQQCLEVGRFLVTFVIYCLEQASKQQPAQVADKAPDIVIDPERMKLPN